MNSFLWLLSVIMTVFSMKAIGLESARKITFLCPQAKNIYFKDNKTPHTWKYIAYGKAIIKREMGPLKQQKYIMQGNVDQKMQVQEAYGASWLEGSFICDFHPKNSNTIDLVLWLNLHYNADRCHFSFGDASECMAEFGKTCALVCQ